MVPEGQHHGVLDRRPGHHTIRLDLVLLDPVPVLSIQIEDCVGDHAEEIEEDRCDDGEERGSDVVFIPDPQIPDWLEYSKLAWLTLEQTGCEVDVINAVLLLISAHESGKRRSQFGQQSIYHRFRHFQFFGVYKITNICFAKIINIIISM